MDDSELQARIFRRKMEVKENKVRKKAAWISKLRSGAFEIPTAPARRATWFGGGMPADVTWADGAYWTEEGARMLLHEDPFERLFDYPEPKVCVTDQPLHNCHCAAYAAACARVRIMLSLSVALELQPLKGLRLLDLLAQMPLRFTSAHYPEIQVFAYTIWRTVLRTYYNDPRLFPNDCPFPSLLRDVLDKYKFMDMVKCGPLKLPEHGLNASDRAPSCVPPPLRLKQRLSCHVANLVEELAYIDAEYSKSVVGLYQRMQNWTVIIRQDDDNIAPWGLNMGSDPDLLSSTSNQIYAAALPKRYPRTIPVSNTPRSDPICRALGERGIVCHLESRRKLGPKTPIARRYVCEMKKGTSVRDVVDALRAWPLEMASHVHQQFPGIELQLEDGPVRISLQRCFARSEQHEFCAGLYPVVKHWYRKRGLKSIESLPGFALDRLINIWANQVHLDTAEMPDILFARFLKFLLCDVPWGFGYLDESSASMRVRMKLTEDVPEGLMLVACCGCELTMSESAQVDFLLEVWRALAILVHTGSLKAVMRPLAKPYRPERKQLWSWIGSLDWPKDFEQDVLHAVGSMLEKYERDHYRGNANTEESSVGWTGDDVGHEQPCVNVVEQPAATDSWPEESESHLGSVERPSVAVCPGASFDAIEETEAACKQTSEDSLSANASVMAMLTDDCGELNGSVVAALQEVLRFTRSKKIRVESVEREGDEYVLQFSRRV